MPHRSYTTEENDLITKLVKKNRKTPAGWQKTRRAFNRKFKNPVRTLDALRTQHHRLERLSGNAQPMHSGTSTWDRFKRFGDRFFGRDGTILRERGLLRAENRDLRQQVKELRQRAETAEGRLRRMETILKAPQRRAAGAMVVHSSK